MNKKVLIIILIVLALIVSLIVFVKNDNPPQGGIVVGPSTEESETLDSAGTIPDTEYTDISSGENDFNEIEAALDSFE